MLLFIRDVVKLLQEDQVNFNDVDQLAESLRFFAAHFSSSHKMFILNMCFSTTCLPPYGNLGKIPRATYRVCFCAILPFPPLLNCLGGNCFWQSNSYEIENTSQCVISLIYNNYKVGVLTCRHVFREEKILLLEDIEFLQVRLNTFLLNWRKCQTLW